MGAPTFNIDDAVRTLSQTTVGRPTKMPSTVPLVDLANIMRRDKAMAEQLVPGVTDYNTAHAKGLLAVQPDGRLHVKLTAAQRAIYDRLAAAHAPAGGAALPPEYIPVAQLKGGMDEARFPGAMQPGFGGIGYLKVQPDGTVMVRNPDHPSFKAYADHERERINEAKARVQAVASE